MGLSHKKCVPCQVSTNPMAEVEIKKNLSLLNDSWKIERNHHLIREYKFKNFAEALKFTNMVGKLAEEEGHHPDILLKYGQVTITLWTHKVNGLTENDFILADKTESLFITNF